MLGSCLKDQIAYFYKGIENKFTPCEDFTRNVFHQLRAKKTMLLLSCSSNRALEIFLCE